MTFGEPRANLGYALLQAQLIVRGVAMLREAGTGAPLIAIADDLNKKARSNNRP
jgi:hypothetical protein